MHAANEVIMPVLGMNQDSGKIVKWLIEEGQPVKSGEPLFEVETDKAIAEIEAPLSGVLSDIKAREGENVPVGEVIAVILTPEEAARLQAARQTPVSASPLAARIAAENGLDLRQVKPQGGRVEKADVLAFLQSHGKRAEIVTPAADGLPVAQRPRPLASPKARRLAAERGLGLTELHGSGPEGAILVADLPMPGAARPLPTPPEIISPASPVLSSPIPEPQGVEITPGSTWRLMAERTAAAWTQAPHFFLLREVDATRLIAWREMVNKTEADKVTYTDLLVRLVAAALRKHPRLNAVYQDGKIHLLPEINIGIAVAVEEGLVVPVIHEADQLSISEIAKARSELVDRARLGRLRLPDISNGTFTISNLGMYGVDAFLAVINTPQSAILAVGRITERVVPVNGQAVIRPMMALSLSFDHRSVDGARGAQFLDTLANLIEEPLGLIS
jgi:pyruvate dehydrogenase E2 component (dihydrolipoamide acetyltransferase)